MEIRPVTGAPGIPSALLEEEAPADPGGDAAEIAAVVVGRAEAVAKQGLQA